jgi:hypothetical protein
MENIDKAVIINCGVNNWYGHGSRRLEKSLNFVGWAGEKIIYADEYPPNSHTHDDIPYYMKIAVFEEAIRRGFTHILFVDSSFWAVSNPMKMFDIISEQGYYFFSSGYNLAQSVNDTALNYVGLSRDEAETVNEWASGCLGFRMDNPMGSALYYRWKELMDAGLSRGSRLHDNQSSDPRFLFHRNDQSCLSLAAWELGLKNEKGLDMVSYWNNGNPGYNKDEIIWFIGGI